MKKLMFFISALLILMVALTACGSEYSDSGGDVYESDTMTYDSYNEDDNNVAGGEIPGIYTETLTGANITFSESLEYKIDISGQYGKGVKFMDRESYPSVQLDIKIDEIYADRIDKAYEKLGFSGAMTDSKLMAYTENYFMVFIETEFFEKISYEYDWVCLLTDGSVLHLKLTSEKMDPFMVAQSINIDFTNAEGEIGLASIYNLPQYEGSAAVAGIWKNAETGYWFDCSGGLLFSIYDELGNIIDCGTYDSFFESLTGYEQSYSAWVDDSGLTIQDFAGVFQLEQTLGIIPGDIPGGIPCEGTQEGEASGELTEYRGKWENDTTSCSVEINRSGINFYGSYDYSNDYYTLTDEGELELSEGELIRIQDDGGLTIDGFEGIFYREGERENAYTPYLGQWYNDMTGQAIWLQDGGGYSYNIDESGFGASVWSVTGEGTLNIGDDEAYIDESGNLVIDGYDGVFICE